MPETTDALRTEPDTGCPECVEAIANGLSGHFTGMRWRPGDPVVRFPLSRWDAEHPDGGKR